MVPSHDRSRETGCWKRRTVVAVLIAGVIAGVTPPASAQLHPPQRFLKVNGGVQPAGRGFVGSALLDHPLFGSERGHLDTSYIRTAGEFWDGGGGVGIWRRLAVGASVSRFLGEGGTSINASLPHPFRFDRPREIRGAETRTLRRETALASRSSGSFLRPTRLSSLCLAVRVGSTSPKNLSWTYTSIRTTRTKKHPLQARSSPSARPRRSAHKPA